MFVFFLIQTSSDIPLTPTGGFLLFQSFNDPDWNKNFLITKSKNYSGKWEIKESDKPQAIEGEKMLIMTESNRYYGISAPFENPIDFKGKSLVVQYEVRFQDGIECGGAYLKLFGDENYVPDDVTNETKYVIMFGPDKCGSTNKVHFIFRHKNPKTDVFEEKHLGDAALIKSDKLTHLYTLIVRPDNSFEILIDGDKVKNGNLLSSFEPPVNPPKEIDDPTDVKPSDWVDNEMMKDPTAKKPDDWNESEPEYIPDPDKQNVPEGWLTDEPKFIVDPSATKPSDWDDDIHGQWEPPTIPNPKCAEAVGCGEYEPPVKSNPLYKGKWKAPMIKNPLYKGVWKPRKIANPNYFEDKNPSNFRPILGIGFELWMVNKNVAFNNIWVGDDEKAVIKWNNAHFIPKHKLQEASQKALEPDEDSPKEPDDTATKTPEEKPKDFAGQVSHFINTIKDSVASLYKENAILTVILVAIVFLVPLSLCFLPFLTRGAPTPSENQGEADQNSQGDGDKEVGQKDDDEGTVQRKQSADNPTNTDEN